VRAVAAALASSAALSEARSGRAGAELLRRGAYELVVMDLESIGDLGSPDDGAVARLAKLAGDALVVALSSDASVSVAMAAMRAGAHDVVTRPIDAAMLRARIGGLARRLGRSPALAALDVAVEDAGRLSAQLQAASAAMHAAVAEAPALAGAPVLPMWRQEQKIIEEAIAAFNGNVALAAAALELSPSTIYRKRQAWADLEPRRGAA
jgi:DNA-binding NtrC family response regulator